MNKEKLMKILKGTKGKIAIGVLAGIIVGGIVSGGTTEQVKAAEELPKVKIDLQKAEELSKNLESEVSELKKENEELNNKVKEAEPWFKMENDKRIAEEKKAEEERIKAEKKAEEERAKAEEEAEKKAKAEEAAALEAKTKTLSNGNFTSGTDFESGKYDIVAVKGGGNVISSNAFSGGINAIMGTANDEFYEKEYKNINLPEGTNLKVDGVTIKLIPKS